MGLTYTQTKQGQNVSSLAVPSAPKAKDTRVATQNIDIPKGWQETLLPTLLNSGMKAYGEMLNDTKRTTELETSNVINQLDAAESRFDGFAQVAREDMSKLDIHSPTYDADVKQLQGVIDAASPSAKLQRTQDVYGNHIETLNATEGLKESDKKSVISKFNSLLNTRVKTQRSASFKEKRAGAVSDIKDKTNKLIQPLVFTGNFDLKVTEKAVNDLMAWGYTETEARTQIYSIVDKQIDNIWDNRDALEDMWLELDAQGSTQEAILETKVSKAINKIDEDALRAEQRKIKATAALKKKAEVKLKAKKAKDLKEAKYRNKILVEAGQFSATNSDHIKDVFAANYTEGSIEVDAAGSWSIVATPEVKASFKNKLLALEQETAEYKTSLDLLKSVENGYLVDYGDLENTKNKKALQTKVDNQITPALDAVLAGDTGQPLNIVAHYMENPDVYKEIQKKITGKVQDALSLFNSKDTEDQALPALLGIYKNMPIELRKGMSDSNREYLNLAMVVGDHPTLLSGLKEIYRNSESVEDARDTLNADGNKEYTKAMEGVHDVTKAKQFFSRMYKLTKDPKVAGEMVAQTYGLVEEYGVNMSRDLWTELESTATKSGDKSNYIELTQGLTLSYVRAKAGTENVTDVKVIKDGEHINILYGKEINGVTYPGKLRLMHSELQKYLTHGIGVHLKDAGNLKLSNRRYRHNTQL